MRSLWVREGVPLAADMFLRSPDTRGRGMPQCTALDLIVTLAAAAVTMRFTS
jgi:hypothetical protein